MRIGLRHATCAFALTLLLGAAATGAAAQDARLCRFDTLCEPGRNCAPTDRFEVTVAGTSAAPTVSYSPAAIHPATPRIVDGTTELSYRYANQTEVLRLAPDGGADLLLPGPTPDQPRIFRGTCASHG